MSQLGNKLIKAEKDIDYINQKLKELKGEKDKYMKLFELGIIGPTLYEMRMNVIKFEIGYFKDVEKDVFKNFNQLYASYIILKSFESDEEEVEQV